MLIYMQRATENTRDDRYRCRLLCVVETEREREGRAASLRWFPPSYLQPGEESLYVGHAGVQQGLLEHTQQQAVGQDEGQREDVTRAPRWRRPGKTRR